MNRMMLLVVLIFSVNVSGFSQADNLKKDKFEGFWLGQNIANWTGLITEMDKIGTAETMPFYTEGDWGKADLPAFWGEGVPHADKIEFYFETGNTPWGADDDTDIEYMYLHGTFHSEKVILTPKEITQLWLTHTYSEEDAPLYAKFPTSKPEKENFLWVSNERARILMEQGVQTPNTSLPENNVHYSMIDAQLTTEIFGLFAPSDPEYALKLAELPIRVSAYGEAANIAQFYVVMHSLASSVDQTKSLKHQTQWLALQARKYLDSDEYPAKMFDYIWQQYQLETNSSNWTKTRDQIYQKYQLSVSDGYSYQNPFDAGINFAASLISLFYGEGDFKRTVKIGSLVGWDSDNPTATWGGLLGYLMGNKRLSAEFGDVQLSELYHIHRTRRNFPDLTPNRLGEASFSQLADMMLVITERVDSRQKRTE